VIGGGESNIDPTNMEAIIKWPIPTNFVEFRRFFLLAHYLQKFMVSFSEVVAPFHTITMSGNIGERNNRNISTS
jgi:hypothetical protein